MDWLINKIADFCRNQGLDQTYWVGYSGGLDSHVLLHILAKCRQQYPLKFCAVHVNHQLSPLASEWALHCLRVCQELQIELIVRTIHIPMLPDQSPEEIAREKRYAELTALLQPNDCLFTAHHSDDQAETVLLQMLRGAGPKGLAAMPLIKSFAKGFHARPLLDVTREDLKHYAIQYQLTWIEDDSNNHVNFSRNFLRHEIFPILKKRWPSVAHTLSRVAKNCGEVQQVLDEVSLQDLEKVMGVRKGTLSIQKILQFDSVRQRHILRAWLEHQHFPIPSAMKMQYIQQHLLHARHDKMPYCTWRGVEVRRYRDDLYAIPCLKKHDPGVIQPWDMRETLDLQSIGRLQAFPVKGKGLCIDVVEVSIRFRQGGEKLKLLGRKGHHDLKKLFQEWGVPPWERHRVPLVYIGERLVAVIGYAMHEHFMAKKEQDGVLLVLDKPSTPCQ